MAPTEARLSLSVRRIEKTYPRDGGTLTVRLNAINLAEGEVVLFAGPSGSGKSTVLAMLAGILPADIADPDRQGAVNGDAWLPPACDTGFVLQTGGLIPYLTLRQNIEEGRLLSRMSGGRGTHHQTEALADRLSIGAVLDNYPENASVGQRQRAAVARAVVHGPRLLFADEPTAALDADNADKLERLLCGFAREFKMTVLIATHRPDGDHLRAARVFRARTHTVGPRMVTEFVEEARP